MTKDGDFKRQVRARMYTTGETYTAARAALLAGQGTRGRLLGVVAYDPEQAAAAAEFERRTDLGVPLSTALAAADGDDWEFVDAEGETYSVSLAPFAGLDPSTLLHVRIQYPHVNDVPATAVEGTYLTLGSAAQAAAVDLAEGNQQADLLLAQAEMARQWRVNGLPQRMSGGRERVSARVRIAGDLLSRRRRWRRPPCRCASIPVLDRHGADTLRHRFRGTCPGCGWSVRAVDGALMFQPVVGWLPCVAHG